jgi:hypothetical protein
MDNNFIRLFETFDKAKGGNPNVATLPYQGFIMQLPNETFLQQTSLKSGIAFSGAIQVDLIDNCGNVKKNINSNFYYESFIDDNGTPQIIFEFGMINDNFYTTPLYLRITDLVNGAIWYSNDFLVTDYDFLLSCRADYWNENEVKKSVRIAKMYEFTPVNENSVKQYTTTQGLRVNSKSITTYLRQWKCDAINYDINDRLNKLFASDVVFLNSQGVVVSDFKSNERKGTTNFLDAEFVVNPQNETYDWEFQVYEGLEVVQYLPLNGGVYNQDDFDGIVDGGAYLNFNKNITSVNGKYKLYKGGVIATELDLTFVGQSVGIDLLDTGYAFTNGTYSIAIAPNQITSGAETFKGFALNEWTFTIADGEYDNTEYSNEYLIN